MAEKDETGTATPPAPRRGMGAKGWLAVGVAAAALAGGGFHATYSGLLVPTSKASTAAEDVPAPSDAAPRFLELDPMTITVGGGGSIRQLRFRAFLEVGDSAGGAVAALQPRILDIFATYLRAVSVDRLEDPTALMHLRAQLLRRVQLLAGAEAVKDLLIVDFVIA